MQNMKCCSMQWYNRPTLKFHSFRLHMSNTQCSLLFCNGSNIANNKLTQIIIPTINNKLFTYGFLLGSDSAFIPSNTRIKQWCPFPRYRWRYHGSHLRQGKPLLQVDHTGSSSTPSILQSKNLKYYTIITCFEPNSLHFTLFWNFVRNLIRNAITCLNK